MSFMIFAGMDLLLDIVDKFLEDVDVMCNISRTLSVLSSEEDMDTVSSKLCMGSYNQQIRTIK